MAIRRIYLPNAYLADITAGEFVAKPDPERTHTLSRLAIATAEKGEFENNPNNLPDSQLLGHFSATRYNPSWAPQVTSEIFHRSDDRSPGILEISGLRLSTEDDDTFTLYKDTDNTARLEEIDLTFELTLGSHLRDYREIVAYLAAAYFEQI